MIFGKNTEGSKKYRALKPKGKKKYSKINLVHSKISFNFILKFKAIKQ